MVHRYMAQADAECEAFDFEPSRWVREEIDWTWQARE